jgi:hypothetical protein
MVRYAQLEPLGARHLELGPHQYSLTYIQPAGVPGQYFLPNGFSHVVFSDMSFGIYQHFQVLENDVVIQGGATPQRVE